MPATTIPAIENSIEKTNQWLTELAAEGGFSDESQAYSALRAVLHALRDRLTVDEATDLASQLPMVVRGFYYEGWKPALAPNKERTPEKFLDRARSSLPRNDVIDLEQAIPAVFGLLDKHLEGGQADHVRNMLPKEIADAYWPR